MKKDKIPLFSRFLNFISSKKEKKSQSYVKEEKSIFNDYVAEVDKKDSSYKDIRMAATLCEEALRIAKQRIIQINRSKITEDKIEEIKYFEQLDESEVEYFKALIDRYVSVIKERNVLRHQIGSFDKAIGNLIDLEEDAKFSLEKMEDSEETQRIFRQDLNHIEGEKMELEEEYEVLQNGKEFFRKFTFVAMVAFAIGAVALLFANVFYEVDIIFSVGILIILIIVMASFIIIFQQKIEQDIVVNIKLRNKAVELLNRKYVVYARYTNYLNYTYKKYKVINSKELRMNLRELDHYKKLISRLDLIRKVIYESEYEIDQFLKLHEIPNNKISLIKFAETINIDNQKRYFDTLLKERGAGEMSLTELDEKHKECWDKLTELKLNSDNEIINDIVKAYYSELEKVMFEVDIDKHRV